MKSVVIYSHYYTSSTARWTSLIADWDIGHVKCLVHVAVYIFVVNNETYGVVYEVIYEVIQAGDSLGSLGAVKVTTCRNIE